MLLCLSELHHVLPDTFDSVHHGPSWLHTGGSAKRHTPDSGRRRSSASPDRDDRRRSSVSPDRDGGHTKIEVVQAELAKQSVCTTVNLFICSLISNGKNEFTISILAFDLHYEETCFSNM